MILLSGFGCLKEAYALQLVLQFSHSSQSEISLHGQSIPFQFTAPFLPLSICSTLCHSFGQRSRVRVQHKSKWQSGHHHIEFPVSCKYMPFELHYEPCFILCQGMKSLCTIPMDSEQMGTLQNRGKRPKLIKCNLGEPYQDPPLFSLALCPAKGALILIRTAVLKKTVFHMCTTPTPSINNTLEGAGGGGGGEHKNRRGRVSWM